MIYQTKIREDPNHPSVFSDPIAGTLYRGKINIHVDTKVITGPLAKKMVEEHKKRIPRTTHPRYEAILNITGKKIGPFIEGVRVEGKLTQWFFDAVLNVGTHGPFGYNDPEILKKMGRWQHLAGSKYAGTDFYTISSDGMPLQADLAALLNKTAKESFGFNFMIKFTNSGTEANEDASKVAMFNKFRQLRQKLSNDLFKQMKKQLGIKEIRKDGLLSNYPMFVIAFKGGFHGRSAGSLTYTFSKLAHKEGYQTIQYVKHLEYDSSVDFENAIDDRPLEKLIKNKELRAVIDSGKVPIDLLSMVIFEPVQGEGGYRFPDDGFLKKLNDFLKKYKDKKKFVFVDDEIQAGMGRTGTIFAIEYYMKKYKHLKPDIITLAKPLLIGAAIIRKELLVNWPGSKFSGTWSGGDVIAIACGFYTLEKLLRKNPDPYLGRTYLENARIGGEELRKGLRELAEKFNEKHPELITNIRGIGQMTAFDLPDSKIRDEYEHELFLHGVHMIATGEKSMRIFGAVDQAPRERKILLKAMEDSVESLLEKLK